jgi:hypothetical protein
MQADDVSQQRLEKASGSMRTTLNVDDRLMGEVKAAAVATGQTLTAWIENALRDVLSRQRRPAARPSFELPTFDLGAPLPGVDINNSAALLDLMEEDHGPL